ncbi:MAG: B12-binding domain-containing radical SAM protein [Deltaproteobacteria bacterium]|nr:B12-binding domain-containing radical SAM protein [Deltaproteobacteria bacterium]MBW2076254.1 B12-binding domain-containing radical SAM protein [Deltaproteobacteria bacterium]MBW2309758.1 B12-binding domain-containing radical SAM protein [Deltaproteobacteria bacterium]
MHYEGMCIRPPSEANSILLQATVGCSHNKCTFCGTYKEKRFRIKDNDIILSDILYAARYMRRLDRLFIMDGDALIIPHPRLKRILEAIQEHLPQVKRIGVYANSKGVKLKSEEELRELRDLGLGIVYYGVETGDDQTLEAIRKGANAQKHLDMGLKVKRAGIKISVTVLLGIAGKERSLIHARATGELLSAMDPDYVGALTLMIIPGTPLANDLAAGRFVLPDNDGLLMELREMIASTNLRRGLFFSNHASNYLPVKIRYPEGKEQALHLIDMALEGKVDLRPEWMRAL